MAKIETLEEAKHQTKEDKTKNVTSTTKDSLASNLGATEQIKADDFNANDRLPYTFDQKEYERIVKEEGPEAAVKYANVNKSKKTETPEAKNDKPKETPAPEKKVETPQVTVEAPKEKEKEVPAKPEAKKETPKETKKEEKKETPKEAKKEPKKEKDSKPGFFKKTWEGIKSLPKHTWNAVKYVPRTVVGTLDMAANTVGLVGLPFNKKEGRKNLLNWYKGKWENYKKKFSWEYKKEKK